MQTKSYKLIQQTPTGPTDQEAHLDSKEKGFCIIELTHTIRSIPS
jgi:hypothetical protein